MEHEDMVRHALRIAERSLDNMEFCNVYEDEELEGASERDLQSIHTIITHDLLVDY